MMAAVHDISPEARWRRSVERKLALKEQLQAQRIELVARQKQELDDVIARHQHEIDNLRATLEMREG